MSLFGKCIYDGIDGSVIVKCAFEEPFIKFNSILFKVVVKLLNIKREGEIAKCLLSFL